MIRWQNLSLIKKIILIVSAGFLLSATMLGAYFIYSEQQQLERLLLKQAKQIFTQIEVARHWNAEHGGLYARLKAGEKANPYLYKVGPEKAGVSQLEPEITDSKGRRFGLINPALMTRELSDESRQHSSIRYHLTSLKLINPGNKPDPFEQASLHAFEAGEPHRISYTEEQGEPYFRYMAPLKVEQACLKCHGFQGYKVGDIRGGISVSIPMRDEIAVSRENSMHALFTGMIVYVVITLILIVAIRQLIGRRLQHLMHVASNVGANSFNAHNITPDNDEIGSLYRTLAATDNTIKTQWQELVSLAREMDEKSRVDALTNIYNRHHLYLEGPKLFARANRRDAPLCTLVLDIDFFKRINDNYGHKVGDDAIRLVANTIHEEVRPYDLFVRFGGEEFLLILPDTAQDEGIEIAERIRLSIEQKPLNIEENAISLTISIGLCCDHEISLDQAIIHADSALYLAKERGRNRVHTFTASPS